MTTTIDRTTIVRTRTRDEDPGIATLPPTASRTHAPAPDPRRHDAGVPWCEACQVHGHATTRCPKANGSASIVSDEHALERILIGSGWDEARR